MTSTLTAPTTDAEVGVGVEEDIVLTPTCEALLDGQFRCGHPAAVIARFASHACPRDGKGVLLCQGCLDWITGPTGAGCGACMADDELHVVSVVRL